MSSSSGTESEEKENEGIWELEEKENKKNLWESEEKENKTLDWKEKKRLARRGQKHPDR